MMIKRDDNNLYIEILRIAKNSKLCVKPGCTTCGCMIFRSIINSCDESKLVNDLYLTNLSQLDEFDYDFWSDATRVIHHFTEKEFIKNKDMPEVMQYIEKVYNQYRAQRDIKAMENIRKENEKTEKLKRIRIQNQENHRGQKEINEEIRSEIVKVFIESPISQKIKIVIHDNKHNPNYYPLHDLINNDFSEVEKNDLIDFYNRLLELRDDEHKALIDLIKSIIK